jgi:uncharacterized protein (DUF2062 family)
MFKRRNPRTLLQQARQLVWPSMGWVRMFKYVRIRILRLRDSTSKIALGLAIGTSIGFTPIIGTHYVQCVLLSWIFRGNIVASLISNTLFANPWTIPFLWWAAIEVGAKVTRLFGIKAHTGLPPDLTFKVFWDLLTHDPFRILVPWLTGGYLLAILSFPIGYYVFYKLITGAKAAKRKVKVRAAHRVAKEVTGQKK